MLSARSTLRTALTTLVAATLAVMLLPASPAAAAKVTVDKRFFGIHDTDATSWPSISVGSLRLWDAGVTWADIQPEQGRFDWTRLDAIVTAAQARNVEVTLVLGQTPA